MSQRGRCSQSEHLSTSSTTTATMNTATLLRGLLVLLCVTGVLSAQSRCNCKEFVWDCSKLNLTSLPAGEKCSTANTLRMGGNLFEDLPDGIKSFETIVASKNKLTRFPSTSKLAPGLKNLELDDNQISVSSQELRSFSTLRRLHVKNNRLSSLEFLPTTCNLFSFDVSKNSISSLSGPLKNCAGLIFLGLSNNEITSIPNDVFSKMNKLKYLHLDSNKIASVPDGVFSGLVALKTLSLSMNRKLVLSSGSFKGLTQLEDLDISFNNLQSLPSGVFSPLSQLVKLDINMNQLPDLPQNVFAGLNKIQRISVWNNKLMQIPTLSNCCNNLEEISFVGNNISSPSEEAMKSLLRGKIRSNLGRHPLRKEALRWALKTKDVEAFVETPCSCGGLRNGQATVKFCVDVQCGVAHGTKDWRDEVKTA